MKIETMKVEDLVPYERNPRDNDGAVDAVANSIKEFGFLVPVVVDKDNVIAAGHTRIKAAKKLGLETVPVVRAGDLTDEQIKAFRLADNKTGELAGWDFDLLPEELKGISEIDMTAFGFEQKEIEDPEDTVEDEFDEDAEDIPERVQMGEVWELGEHRLKCGDSTSSDDLDSLLGGVRPELVFTDPPYGMALDTDFRSMKSNFKGKTGGNKYDQRLIDEFDPAMIDSVLSIDSEECFLWGADYYSEYIPNRNQGSWIVWDKRTNENTSEDEWLMSDKMFGSCFELCWSKKKHKREIARVKWAGIFGMGRYDQKKRIHPTQKPIELCVWFLKKYSKCGDLVCDIFGGSGSTMIACEQFGRRCYMMEIDPHYCDVIIKRWEEFTGKKAVKIEEG